STRTMWREATGIEMVDGIGSTEMLHIFIASAGDEVRPGATGKVVPGYQACILDENGHQLPPGTIGRLGVKGPTGCRYLADERQRTYVQQNIAPYKYPRAIEFCDTLPRAGTGKIQRYRLRQQGQSGINA